MNLITSFFIFLFSLTAISEMIPQEGMKLSQGISFGPIESQLLRQYAPMLYGGRRIREGELRPSVYIGNCTATVVGPQSIITAGHCRGTGSSAAFTYDRIRYSGRCTRHPQYNNGPWMNNDFALCKFSPAINMPVWGSLQKTTVSVGEVVTMQGYGAGSNGYLNVGDAPVIRADNMEYITQNSVHLGGGDSGGALFKKADLVNGPFLIVGINSRGGGNTSLFNRTDLDRSQSWFKKWASDNSTEVCGINRNCDGVPAPDLCPVENDIVQVLKFELGLAEKNLEACLAASL